MKPQETQAIILGQQIWIQYVFLYLSQGPLSSSYVKSKFSIYLVLVSIWGYVKYLFKKPELYCIL